MSITIEVTKQKISGPPEKAGFEARVTGHPEIWGQGKTES